jgi:hypothetical protein
MVGAKSNAARLVSWIQKRTAALTAAVLFCDRQNKRNHDEHARHVLVSDITSVRPISQQNHLVIDRVVRKMQ